MFSNFAARSFFRIQFTISLNLFNTLQSASHAFLNSLLFLSVSDHHSYLFLIIRGLIFNNSQCDCYPTDSCLDEQVTGQGEEGEFLLQAVQLICDNDFSVSYQRSLFSFSLNFLFAPLINHSLLTTNYFSHAIIEAPSENCALTSMSHDSRTSSECILTRLDFLHDLQ